LEAYRHLGLPGKTEHRQRAPRSVTLRIALIFFALAGLALALVARVMYLIFVTLLGWSDRLIYLGLLVVEPALIARLFLHVLGLEAIRQTSERVYAVTAPLVMPFAAAPSVTVGTHVLELGEVAAVVAYPIGAWFVIAILNLFKRLPW